MTLTPAEGSLGHLPPRWICIRACQCIARYPAFRLTALCAPVVLGNQSTLLPWSVFPGLASPGSGDRLGRRGKDVVSQIASNPTSDYRPTRMSHVALAEAARRVDSCVPKRN